MKLGDSAPRLGALPGADEIPGTTHGGASFRLGIPSSLTRLQDQTEHITTDLVTESNIVGIAVEAAQFARYTGPARSHACADGSSVIA